jgi:vancomycin permeability regulator SanA
MLLLTVLLLTLGVSCTTTEETYVEPFDISVSFPAKGTYTILGRVDYVANRGNAGYKSFLEYAKSVYPLTDDVVNVIVDSKDTYEVITNTFTSTKTSTLKSSVYTMSGIAIQYK